MKTPSKLDYSHTPSIKKSSTLLAKALLRRFYIKPKLKLAKMFSMDGLLSLRHRLTVRFYKLPIDDPIIKSDGIKGLHLVASYTDKDKGYLSGMIDSCEAFEKIILYHDKNSQGSFGFNESLRFQLLVAAARRNGAKWVLIGSPKSRFSTSFRSQIEPHLKKHQGDKVVLVLKERLLWEKFDQYVRIGKAKAHGKEAEIKKLFSISDKMIFDNKPIHAKQFPINYNTLIRTEASRYYLGRFNSRIMNDKATFYSKLDGKDYHSILTDVSDPLKHGETLLGIGEYEKKELLGE